MPHYVYAMAEDAVAVAITERLLLEFQGKFTLYGEIELAGNKNNLNDKIQPWNVAATSMERNANGSVVFFMLRDLDSLAHPQNPDNCPETEMAALMENKTKSNNLILRFAVAESENWLLADYDGLRRFLSLRTKKPISPDAIRYGKKEIIALAQRSSKREYRTEIPPKSADRKIGPRYNDILTDFIRNHWDIREAANHSKSLHRTLNRLAAFPKD